MKSKTTFKGVFALVICTFIWGTAFVAQSAGMEKIGAFTFSAVRSWFTIAVLVPFIIIRDKKATSKLSDEALAIRKNASSKAYLLGLPLGLAFCVACNLQQYAFNYSTSGKIAFITSTYMFFVPLIGMAFGKRVSKITWGCIVLAFIGVFLLSFKPGDSFAVNMGDLLALGCSVFFAVQITMLDKMVETADPIVLNCMQFIVNALISTALMFMFEKPAAGDIFAAIVPLLYAGVLSGGLAYSLQAIGQKHTEPTLASLIMCTESVFAVVAAAIILKEIMSLRETAGCIIMFVAVVVCQLGQSSLFKRKTSDV